MPLIKNNLCERGSYEQWLLYQLLALDVQELPLRLSNRQSAMVNALVLSYALPSLRLNETIDQILLDIDVKDTTVKHLNKILHTGEVYLNSEEEEQEFQKLCRALQINTVSNLLDNELVDTEFYDPLSSPSMSTSVIPMERKSKSKRVFTANLTAADLTCQICDRTFSAMYKLNIHNLIHSSTPPFLCNHCGRGFNNKYKMRAHEKRHCSPDYSSRLKANSRTWLLTTSDADCLDKGINCEKCGALFDTKKSRMDHILAAHPLYHASTHSCHTCQKVFKNIKGLRNHEKNVKCSRLLSSSKRRKTDVDQQHQSNADAEVPLAFKCLRCTVICSSKKSLRNHTKTAHWQELGEDEALPFRCLPCGKAFLKQSYFEEHQNRYHALVKAFACMFCPKRCATKQGKPKYLNSMDIIFRHVRVYFRSGSTLDFTQGRSSLSLRILFQKFCPSSIFNPTSAGSSR